LYIRPYAPTNPSASTASQTQINLSWTLSSDDPGSVDSYNVYFGNGSHITNLPAGTSNYAVGNLNCGSSYSFYVTAVRQGVESDPSNTAMASTASCASIVSVTSVWTTDGSWDSKSIFQPGDSIIYVGRGNNASGSDQTAYFDWEVSGPCGSIASWTGNLNAANGGWEWGLPTNIPSNACGGTYTYQLSVTYNGSTTSQSATFTVANPTVQVVSTWTADNNGNSKTVFKQNDGIQYVGNVYNDTGTTQIAYAVWSVNGPCGSIASWSGNLNTGTDMWTWWLQTSVPGNACGGTYTYQLSLTYNSSTTSRSSNFVVEQLPHIYLPLIEKGGGSSAPTRLGTPTMPTTKPLPIGKPAGSSPNVSTTAPSPAIAPSPVEVPQH
jgi:hypothetical protein